MPMRPQPLKLLLLCMQLFFCVACAVCAVMASKADAAIAACAASAVDGIKPVRPKPLVPSNAGSCVLDSQLPSGATSPLQAQSS
eukprot:scaffold51075_cov20-Tisochrysis_lutea.AAC.1